jgi:MtfA peptidase
MINVVKSKRPREMWSFKSWRRERVLSHAALPQALWGKVIAELPVLYGLSDTELERLRSLVILFLHEKDFLPINDLLLTEEMRLSIAVQACLPILDLGLDYYAGWMTVIVYPGGFIARHEQIDAAGVVHAIRRPSAGESWQRGPVVLSWEDVERSRGLDGFNVVIHEFAHKLDMLNGTANGFPPLHIGMSIQEWTRVFTEAYATFCLNVRSGADCRVSAYASESPAEFFAVLSEAFFEIPHELQNLFPEVYAQLAAFYRQDPALRMPADCQSEMTENSWPSCQ